MRQSTLTPLYRADIYLISRAYSVPGSWVRSKESNYDQDSCTLLKLTSPGENSLEYILQGIVWETHRCWELWQGTWPIWRKEGGFSLTTVLTRCNGLWYKQGLLNSLEQSVRGLTTPTVCSPLWGPAAAAYSALTFHRDVPTCKIQLGVSFSWTQRNSFVFQLEGIVFLSL